MIIQLKELHYITLDIHVHLKVINNRKPSRPHRSVMDSDINSSFGPELQKDSMNSDKSLALRGCCSLNDGSLMSPPCQNRPTEVSGLDAGMQIAADITLYGKIRVDNCRRFYGMSTQIYKIHISFFLIILLKICLFITKRLIQDIV